MLDDGDICPVHVRDLMGEGDDFQRAPQCSFADELLFGEDREHLEHDAACSHARQPIVAEGISDTPFSAVHACQQQVIVGIGDWQAHLRQAGRQP